MKYILNLAIAISITLITAFICCKSEAVATEKLTASQKKLALNAQLTYKTVLPVYDHYSTNGIHRSGYVIYAPNQVKLYKLEFVNELDVKQKITFFEQATLFNDKLQSWLN